MNSLIRPRAAGAREVMQIRCVPRLRQALVGTIRSCASCLRPVGALLGLTCAAMCGHHASNVAGELRALRRCVVDGDQCVVSVSESSIDLVDLNGDVVASTSVAGAGARAMPVLVEGRLAFALGEPTTDSRGVILLLEPGKLGSEREVWRRSGAVDGARLGHDLLVLDCSKGRDPSLLLASAPGSGGANGPGELIVVSSLSGEIIRRVDPEDGESFFGWSLALGPDANKDQSREVIVAYKRLDRLALCALDVEGPDRLWSLQTDVPWRAGMRVSIAEPSGPGGSTCLAVGLPDENCVLLVNGVAGELLMRCAVDSLGSIDFGANVAILPWSETNPTMVVAIGAPGLYADQPDSGGVYVARIQDGLLMGFIGGDEQYESFGAALCGDSRGRIWLGTATGIRRASVPFAQHGLAEVRADWRSPIVEGWTCRQVDLPMGR